MKISIFVIGLIIMLGGTIAVLAPKPWTMIGGGTKYNKTITVTEFSKESSVYFGWGAIVLGISATVVGLRYDKIVMQPTDAQSDDQ
jgi:hypothetical protein